jgi:hypothetical protein
MTCTNIQTDRQITSRQVASCHGDDMLTFWPTMSSCLQPLPGLQGVTSMGAWPNCGCWCMCVYVLTDMQHRAVRAKRIYVHVCKLS